MADHKASCPYAVSLSDDEDNGSQRDNLLEVAMTSCPAFESGSCPFKDAKNSEQVRHALLNVPPSHLEESGHFSRALRHLHHVSETVQHQHDERFAIPGGCPVAQSYSPHVSFAAAMEDYSLASVMARMAQDLMDQENDGEADEKVSADTTDGDAKEKVSAITKNGNDEKASITTKDAAAEAKQSTQQQEGTNNDESLHPVGLSEALKTGTAASHQAAEGVHFVHQFIKGNIDRQLFAELTLSLYHVYTQLEESLNQHAPQYFASCHFPRELSRKEALEEDVDFWHGSLPNRISPATQDYVDRIQYLAKTDPLLLLAHAYTRYLGDLSGGKILARVARKAMQLDTDGLDFYEFKRVSSAKLFKDQYRTALDNLRLSPTQVSKLVAEANVAFVLNMRLFEELDVMANIEGAQVRDLQEALDFANATVTQEHGKKEECPFAKMSEKSSSSTGECPFAKMSRKMAAMKRQVPPSFVMALVLCAVWWAVQPYLTADAAEMPRHTSLVHAVLEPFQDWDGRMLD